MMYGHEKSRSAIVAGKPTNKAERSAAELVERRAETKGNAGQQRTRRAQYRISVSKMLARIRQHIFAVDTQGGNRMRESCTYGSVRGALSNERPYRDRREFITLLGGAVAGRPRAARAQQADRVRRIGVLAPGTNDDPAQQSRLKVFQDALRELGWTEGRNVRIEIRLAVGKKELFATYAAELVAAGPDVLLADSTPS